MPEKPGGKRLSAVSAIASGRVQGVGYRYSAQREARRLGLKGWVRNLPSGDVEAWVEGDSDAIGDFLEWMREGPPGAWVQDLVFSRRELKGLNNFTIED